MAEVTSVADIELNLKKMLCIGPSVDRHGLENINLSKPTMDIVGSIAGPRDGSVDSIPSVHSSRSVESFCSSSSVKKDETSMKDQRRTTRTARRRGKKHKSSTGDQSTEPESGRCRQDSDDTQERLHCSFEMNKINVAFMDYKQNEPILSAWNTKTDEITSAEALATLSFQSSLSKDVAQSRLSGEQIGSNVAQTDLKNAASAKHINAEKKQVEKVKKNAAVKDSVKLQTREKEQEKSLSAKVDSTTDSLLSQASETKEPKNSDQVSLLGESLLLQELEAAGIFALKKKAARFPEAKYFCRLCEYHCNSLEYCQKHMNDARHQRLQLRRDEQEFIRDLSAPSTQHEVELTECLENLSRTITLTDVELKHRQNILKEIEHICSSISQSASFVVYGSTVSGMNSLSCDLNIDLRGDDIPTILCDLRLALDQEIAKSRSDKRNNGLFKSVRSDFSSKLPCIYVEATPAVRGQDPVTVQITIDNDAAVRTSALLRVYTRIDPRVRPLGIAFRRWAQICKVDKQTEGTLPGYVYGLLTIYYLQQCQPPVLPVLHEMLTDADHDCVNDKQNNKEYRYLDDLDKLRSRWRCSNEQSLGYLWFDMLRFYCIQFDVDTTVVCIRQKALLSRSEKKWTSKKLAVEDPFYRKRNVARSLSHAQVYEFIDHRLRMALMYFAKWLVDGTTYEFTQETLADSNEPAVICSLCQKDGHTKFACTKEALPPLKPLPRITKQHLAELDNFLKHVPNDFQPDIVELQHRERVVNELLIAIRKTYPDARLCLFGSSCNGFGFQRSDLDISMTFARHPTAESLNCVFIIEELAQLLRRQGGLYNILPITTAKVPIVKFTHRRSQLEGDISLYNTLAQHNTHMLLTYSQIDPRVKILGYIIKVFAKCCDICDASRGSLSSYAYILMMIFYLQRTSPPVIPVLQELYPKSEKKPEVMVDGWNAWFYDDLKSLDRVWGGREMNRQSVSELWIGLLQFYTENIQFNLDEFVVSIRREKPVTKFEKMWTRSRGITIEDPFNLDHNLGLGLSRNMNLFIVKVFRNARSLFGTPITRLPDGYVAIQDYFFDYDQLTKGATQPNDRGCRRCGKIGHFVSECPLNKGKRKSPIRTDTRATIAMHETTTATIKTPATSTVTTPGTTSLSTTRARTVQSKESASTAGTGTQATTMSAAVGSKQEKPAMATFKSKDGNKTVSPNMTGKSKKENKVNSRGGGGGNASRQTPSHVVVPSAAAAASDVDQSSRGGQSQALHRTIIVNNKVTAAADQAGTETATDRSQQRQQLDKKQQLEKKHQQLKVAGDELRKQTSANTKTSKSMSSVDLSGAPIVSTAVPTSNITARPSLSYNTTSSTSPPTPLLSVNVRPTISLDYQPSTIQAQVMRFHEHYSGVGLHQVMMPTVPLAQRHVLQAWHFPQPGLHPQPGLQYPGQAVLRLPESGKTERLWTGPDQLHGAQLASIPACVRSQESPLTSVMSEQLGSYANSPVQRLDQSHEMHRNVSIADPSAIRSSEEKVVDRSLITGGENRGTANDQAQKAQQQQQQKSQQHQQQQSLSHSTQQLHPQQPLQMVQQLPYADSVLQQEELCRLQLQQRLQLQHLQQIQAQEYAVKLQQLQQPQSPQPVALLQHQQIPQLQQQQMQLWQIQQQQQMQQQMQGLNFDPLAGQHQRNLHLSQSHSGDVQHPLLSGAEATLGIMKHSCEPNDLLLSGVPPFGPRTAWTASTSSQEQQPTYTTLQGDSFGIHQNIWDSTPDQPACSTISMPRTHDIFYSIPPGPTAPTDLDQWLKNVSENRGN